MIRTFQGGAIYSDQRVSGERVCCIPGKTLKTHASDIAFPPGEPWGLMFLCQTTRGPWKFAGKAHGTGNCWEWIAGKWTEHGLTNGTNGFIYDLAGNLHIIAPGKDVTSQGYRRNADGSISSGDATYGPWNGLSEYMDLGDDLWIGQGDPQHGTPTGAILWDARRKVHLLLQAGNCTFIRPDRVGESVSLTFSTKDGTPFIQTTMAELRSLPVIVTPPGVPVPVPPIPVPPVTSEPVKMRLPDDVQRIVTALYNAHLDLANGSDDQRRALTQLIVEQVVYTYPLEGWGWKSADPNRPLSKDSIAKQQDGRLLNFDLFDGTTRRPNDHPESEDITGQTFRPWPGVDHLGSPPPVQDQDAPPADSRELDRLRAENDALRVQLAEAQREQSHTSYDAMMALVNDMERAYLEGRGFRPGMVMPPATTAHLVYRFLVEGYSSDALVQDARERGQG